MQSQTLWRGRGRSRPAHAVRATLTLGPPLVGSWPRGRRGPPRRSLPPRPPLTHAPALAHARTLLTPDTSACACARNCLTPAGGALLALSVGTSMETVTGVTVAFCSHLLRAPYSASCSRRVWGPAPRDPASQTYVRAEPSLRLQGPPPPSKPQPGAQGSAPRRPLQEAPPRPTPQTSRVLPASRESVGAARTGGPPTSAVSPTRTSTSRTALPRPSPAGPKAGGTWPKPSRRVSALVLGPSRTAGRLNRDLPAWGSLRAASSTGGRSRGPACGRPEEQSGAGCLSWSPGLTVQRETPRPPPATPRAFSRPWRPLARRRPPRLTPTPPRRPRPTLRPKPLAALTRAVTWRFHIMLLIYYS